MSTRPPWEVDDSTETPPWEVDDSVVQPLSGATEIKPQPPLWRRVLSEAGGFAKEIPLIGARAVNLLGDVAQGKKPWDPALEAERSARMRKIEEALGAAETSGLPEQRPGRILARMAPGAAAAYLTGGMSIPAQAAIQGGVQGLQSLSEGASPEAAFTGAGIAGLAPWAGRVVNTGLSFAKAPFKRSVDQAALDAAQNLGVELPASAVTKSPMARNIETLSGKLIGGQRITDRATGAAEGLRSATVDTVPAGAEAVGAGTKIAEEVAAARRAAQTQAQMLESERQAFDAAQRQARQGLQTSISKPTLAAEAGPKTAAGLSAKRKALQKAEDAIWEKADLRPVAAPMEQTIETAKSLLERGDLPPNDLAFLQKFIRDVGPRKMVQTPEGLVPIESVPPDTVANFHLPVVEVPPQANEILSQLRGLRQRVPYGAGQGVFGSDALRKHLAGTLKDELQRVVSEANPELGQAFAQANALHSGSIDVFKSPWGRQIAKLERGGQISKIPEILSPKMAPEDVQNLLRTVGPEGADALRANVLDRILTAARGADGVVDPAKVTKEMARWGGNLDQVLGPNEMQTLSKLGVPVKEFQVPGEALGPPTAGQFLEEKAGKTVEGLYGTGQAGKVVENLINTKSSAQEIQAVMQAAGPAADEVRANVLSRILKVAGGNEAKITPESIANEIRRWNPVRLKTILTEEQYARLQDLVTASRAMGRASKIAEGSQTTPWLKASQYLGAPGAIITAILTGNPGTAAGIAGGLALEAGTSRWLGGPTGQRWLTTGLKPSVLPGTALRVGGVGTSRIPSEVEMEKRRQRLLDALRKGP